jgi:hypothetical protein
MQLLHLTPKFGVPTDGVVELADQALNVSVNLVHADSARRIPKVSPVLQGQFRNIG